MRRWTRWALLTGAVAIVGAAASFQKPAPVAAEEEPTMPMHCRVMAGWICYSGTSPIIVRSDMCRTDQPGCSIPADDTR